MHDGIRCPNHGVPLRDLPDPLTPVGVGVCPISGCSFEYEAELDEEETETVVDKFGNTHERKKYKVTGEEN